MNSLGLLFQELNSCHTRCLQVGTIAEVEETFHARALQLCMAVRVSAPRQQVAEYTRICFKEGFVSLIEIIVALKDILVVC